MLVAVQQRCLRTATSVTRAIFQVQTKRNYADEPKVATPGKMLFTFASPSDAFYQSSENVKQVDVPTGTGTIGILANHVPTLGVLKPGVLTVVENEGAVNKYFVSSGSFTVNEDASVQIAAEEAVPLEHLDKELARNNLVEAQSQLSSASDDAARMEAQIAITCNEAIISSTS